MVDDDDAEVQELVRVWKFTLGEAREIVARDRGEPADCLVDETPR